MDTHATKVAKISARVKEFYERRRQFRIYHGTTLSTRQILNSRDDVVNTISLSSVVSINTTDKTALVEPNVSMDVLVEHTLKYKLLPPVVMEFPGITVGGGFSGASGESSSFRYGLFCETVRSVEIVLGDGQIVSASPTDPKTSDLFHEAAGSCGSLGVVSLVELKLIDSKDYVELSYIPVSSSSDALRVIHGNVKDETIDYIDGIMFSETCGTIMAGRLTNEPELNSRVQKFTRPRDPWFYLHANTVTKGQSGDTAKVFIPIRDYLFRYDRGGFWSGTLAFRYFYTPFNRVTRWALDSYMRTRVMLHALHSSGLAKEAIIQDLTLPYGTTQDLIDYVTELTGIFPLWLCPVRGINPGSATCFAHGKTNRSGEIFVNVGLWGHGPRREAENIAMNRDIEQKVQELGGVKILYARTYYTEDEFWRTYDEKRYVAVRQKYHASSLPSVYEKVRVPTKDYGKSPNESTLSYLSHVFWDTWPFGALYGVLKAAFGGEYLLRN